MRSANGETPAIRSALGLLVLLFAFSGPATSTEDMEPREGWAVRPTASSFETLVDRTRDAVRANGLIVVTQAGPTKAAAKRGIKIPGNLVIGVFNNDFAVRVLELSTAAMIEAPIRLYLTENADGTATLSYKTPSHVFAPYIAESGAGLFDISAQLDDLFETIAKEATR
ncbi:MAG: DUF302 domain-containing protein [Pseudomonadota bacterium]